MGFYKISPSVSAAFEFFVSAVPLRSRNIHSIAVTVLDVLGAQPPKSLPRITAVVWEQPPAVPGDGTIVLRRKEVLSPGVGWLQWSWQVCCGQGWPGNFPGSSPLSGKGFSPEEHPKLHVAEAS